MKAREAALRLKRFEADEKARRVQEIEQMIRELEAVAHDLERQILAEEDRTGVRDATHFSYSTFAKSAAARRQNLQASVSELRNKLAAAERDHATVADQVTRVSAPEPRTALRARRRHERRVSELPR